MADKTPMIATLQPIVLGDNRRVSMEMTIEHLPTTFSNVMLTMPEMLSEPPTRPPKPNPQEASPYPDIELSILNSQRQQVATLFIVEHKEPYTALTLHIPRPDPTEQYTARAEMTYDNKILDVVEVPFQLNR